MNGARIDSAGGRLRRLLASTTRAFAALLGLLVPRLASLWVFGGGLESGDGGGMLAVARELGREDPQARIVWLVNGEPEGARAEAQGFEVLPRRSWAGFWATLRAGQIVVSHGPGEANRLGAFGGRVVALGDGALMQRPRAGEPKDVGRVSLFVAGSVAAAERLRSAYGLDPGRVAVLGDARADIVCAQAADSGLAAAARARLHELLGSQSSQERAKALVLYAPSLAPSRRDGEAEAEPVAPSWRQAQDIQRALEAMGASMHALEGDLEREIVPLLGAFDAVITDRPSIAVDFALLGRPIVWFAPELERDAPSPSLYEPLEVTAAGRVQRDWEGAMRRLAAVLADGAPRRVAQADARVLAARFHAHPEGGAAARVVAEIRRLSLRDEDRVPMGAVFFECCRGRRIGGDPLALDREIARRFPAVPRFWSVVDERLEVPDGAVPLLVGSAHWHAARRRARLIVVDDRLGFGPRRGGRRRRELLLSQSPRASERLREDGVFRGEILELGAPRNDRLARAVAGGERIGIAADGARRALGVPAGQRVLALALGAKHDAGTADPIDARALAHQLGDEWFVADVSRHPDANDSILAADLLVADCCAIMCDASVARVPTLCFGVESELAVQFGAGETLPGPAVASRQQLLEAVRGEAPFAPAPEQWRERFAPRDDGRAAQRAVDALCERGALG